MDEDKKQYGLPDDEYYMLIDEKIRKRKEERIERKKKEQRKAKEVLLFVVLAIGLAAFSFSGFFTVRAIEVEGNSYFTPEEIINMGHAEKGSNIIYRPGKSEIKEYLEANPYIESAKIKRKLPGTLVISVKERTQTAAVVYDDDYLIIDENGTLLRKTATMPKLTIVQGIKVSKIELGQKLGSEDSAMIDRTVEILQSMIEGDLYFTRIVMSDLYVKAYVYESLVCKGTADMLVEAMDSGRLHKVLEDLFSKNIKRGTITISEDGYASFVPSLD
ncbi:MAG: cell division protein FtsQ/DivIB [Anaerovoracaceae bacterium]